MKDDTTKRIGRGFVWTDSEPPKAQVYAVFRTVFDLDETPLRAVLRIFADTRYVLWINGRYAERGPCRFDVSMPEYDTVDVSSRLHAGTNAVAVLVHYYAVGSFPAWHEQCARMMEHRPGLTAEFEIARSDGSVIRLPTGPSWRWTTETRHLPSPGTYSSIPDVIDARRGPGDWTAAGFDHSNWKRAVQLPADAFAPLRPRAVPLLRETEIEDLELIEVTARAAGPGPIAGELPSADETAAPSAIVPGPIIEALPQELPAGARAVIDCRREVQAYAVLDFEASEGTKIEVGFATRFRDSNGPAGATFGGTPNRYMAREGRQSYMTTDTFGSRYVVVTVVEGRIALLGCRVVDRRYPFNRSGRFACGEGILNDIWEIGVRTVEVCSEDAHVDCADRERAQWMADGYVMGYAVSRIALTGPGTGGRPHYADGRLLRHMLQHVASSQLPDGRLQPMRPSEYPAGNRHGVIDDYSCLWVQAITELYRRDGDLDLVVELLPAVITAMDYFLNRRTEGGLVFAGEFVYFHNPLAYVRCEGATINAFVYRALRDAAELCQAAGDPRNAARFTDAADRLYDAYDRGLWDERVGAYHGAVVRRDPPVPADSPPSFSEPYTGDVDAEGRTPPTGHAALMALSFGLVPVDRVSRVFEYMMRTLPGENPFPYTCAFLLELLYRRDNEETDRAALDTIRRGWSHMTAYETGTTSEDWSGGSFVHESGAHPTYFLSSYVLGVRTDGPREARRLLVDPRLGGLSRAEGTVLTEFGPVIVRWERGGDGVLAFEVENLTTIPAVLSLRLPADSAEFVLDGRRMLDRDGPAAGTVVEQGRVCVRLGSGRHGGRLAQIRA